MTVDYRTRDRVQAEALAFRQRHNALDWNADVDDLIKLHGLAHDRYSRFGRLGDVARFTTDVAKKVLALVSLKESVILTSTELPSAKEPFAKGHELGHAVLPWHRDILYVCDEHDLSAATRAQMEWEANTFSAAVILPRPLVETMYENFPVSMDTVRKLADLSGASVAASANAYIEHFPKPGLLMWLKEEDGELVLTRKRLSRSAVGTPLSRLQVGQRFSSRHTPWVNSRTRYSTQSCRLRFTNGPDKYYSVSVFNNGYTVYALEWDPEA